MCTNVTTTIAATGSVYDGEDWFAVDRAVVYFDHPQDLLADHAMCIDLWAPGTGVGRRVAVELDADSARRLAEGILDVLSTREVQDVLQPVAVAHQRDV